ncbi:MAG: filamentous hemagglutinin family protein [Verrucomicrobia bacterium]|nr:filamentous hemagglutinin family protein [Verrucomicrobiota bacterium]
MKLLRTTIVRRLSRPTGLLIAALCLLALVRLGYAGDILRGGAANIPGKRSGSSATSSASNEAAAQVNAAAKDRLARTTAAVNAVKNMQQKAAAAASVPDGLGTGGLKVLEGASARWTGASLPTQSGTTVNIRQNEAQAILHWETFNVGRQTTVNFDQSKGGSDVGKWVAFNKVFDPSGKPSQILGKINAQGQVYIINQNGIIFGGGSQVNTRTLVASSLPINDNLIDQGLLNLSATSPEFLFSAITQGTFVPPTALTADGRSGAVQVEKGAVIESTVSGDGSGGRVALVGPTVRNSGRIATPAGQTILAAGLQVGFDAHDSSDPSLRGLDTYIGAVGSYAGEVVNDGVIEAAAGSITMAGKTLRQNGVIDSVTTVTLNGRIDLQASYNAVPNYSYDPSSPSGTTTFLHQDSGSVLFGAGSVTRVLPDLESALTTVGTELPLASQINVRGRDVYFGADAMMQASSGEVTIQAGTWAPVTVTTSGTEQQITRSGKEFLYNAGNVYLESGAFIDVAGITDIAVPLENSIVTVQLRGNELAVSPLQRDSAVRGTSLVIDLRKTGTYNGRSWIGTPLGDTSAFADVIQRTAGQLSVAGGTIEIEAGGSVIAKRGSVLDVSGGYSVMQGGMVKTSRLLVDGNLVSIEDATPDRLYDGIYSGTSTRSHAKWGVSKTYALPLSPGGSSLQSDYIEGAAGGTLRITAPTMALDGDLIGRTIDGTRQLRGSDSTSELAPGSSLRLAFEKDGSALFFGEYRRLSPTPPAVTFGQEGAVGGIAEFVEQAESLLAPQRQSTFSIAADFYSRSGFSSVDIENSAGDFEVPSGVLIEMPAEGTLAVTSRNARVEGSIRSPGGTISLTSYNLSKYAAALLRADNTSRTPDPAGGAGLVLVGSNSRLDVSGSIVDDRIELAGDVLHPIAIKGGSVSLIGYDVQLQQGAVIDASGGVYASSAGGMTYGDGGSIKIEAGNDPGFASLLGGRLLLGADLRGYSGAAGGSLSIKAPLIQIGGHGADPDTLLLQPSFFNQGGFSQFHLTGIGRPAAGTAAASVVQSFDPAIYVAPGTTIAPYSESLTYDARINGATSDSLQRTVKPLGERTPVSIGLYSQTIRNELIDPQTFIAGQGLVVRRGDIVISQGVEIATEPGGSITLEGSTVAVFGSLIAPGGEITISGDGSFPLNTVDAQAALFARTTVYLASSARLSAAGVVVPFSDPYGRRIGTLFDGGAISVSGNIVAESGAILDVSGASAMLEYHPSRLGQDITSLVSARSGVLAKPYGLQVAAVRVDSDGGSIELAGGQMLYSQAKLYGAAGGPSAAGGTLAVSSGRFYINNTTDRTSADINLIVTQSASGLGDAPRGVGLTVSDRSGSVIAGIGRFSVDAFELGGFDSLDLGFNYVDASPFSYGGNVRFEGDVNITARGSLRVAAGGVIEATGAVSLAAPYVAVGQEFRAPLNPSDIYVPFQRVNPADPTQVQNYGLAPTNGSGSLRISGELIDIGTLSLQKIGNASLIAAGGDIRGNGTLNIAGSLSLTAAQVYPTTLADFKIFAYDSAAGPGSVTISASGRAQAPLSGAGNLAIYASQIQQSGVLLAPFGTITLGWDGTDLDTSDADLDAPFDIISRGAQATPTSSSVVLAGGSVTSVSGLDYWTGEQILVPIGRSSDGLSIIDARGINVTVSGLPEKQVLIAGQSVTTEAGSVVDLRGGGDLFAYRWVSGNGGTTDVLGVGTTEWSAGSSYESGALVSYGGKTWSARVAIDPQDFAQGAGPTPATGRYWLSLPESYTIVPGYTSGFAPYSAFNTGSNSGLLEGDAGFVDPGLATGSQITLRGVSGLPDGTYTLLPSRYALLPGAYLVTPSSDSLRLGYVNSEGATITSGFISSSFNTPEQSPALQSVFEVVSADVLGNRAQYEVFDLSAFLTEAAVRLGVDEVQRRPADSGYLSLHGNTALSLSGSVLSRPAADGARGSRIDISSLSDITIGTGGSSGIVLDPAVLNAFGAESLVIGGQRKFSDDGATLTVRTPNIIVSNAGSPLVGSDITLAALNQLSFLAGSSIIANGSQSEAADAYLLTGRGAAVRVSVDRSAQLSRTAPTSSNLAHLVIQDGVSISGAAAILDSSYAFEIGQAASLYADALIFGAGQISIVLAGNPVLAGSTVPQHLVLAGSLLQAVQQSDSLTLKTYQSSIDIYGDGVFGSSSQLSLETGSIRGFGQTGAGATLQTGILQLSNPADIAAAGSIMAPSGSLIVNADNVILAGGEIALSQFVNVIINSRRGVLFSGDGDLAVEKDITINTPVLAASNGADQGVSSGGLVHINDLGEAGNVSSGLGASLAIKGLAVSVNSDISLPSGLLELRATGGDVTIGGQLSVAGITQSFYDTQASSDGGTIRLISDTGDVVLVAGGHVSVDSQAEAGTIIVQAANGEFLSQGTISGRSGDGLQGGDFALDVWELPSFSALNTLLTSGGFDGTQQIRVRNGDVLVSGLVRANDFSLSADRGSITVAGTIDASGFTGGSIVLSAKGDLVLLAGSLLDASARYFDNAGKGGNIRLETQSVLDIRSGSDIDLSVDEYVAGGYQTPGSSAFYGQFQGTLHLRAPRIGNDVAINSIQGRIEGASSILVEAYRVYDRTGVGTLDNTLRDTMNADNASFMNAGYAAMEARLLSGNPNTGDVSPVLVIAPGVEIINTTGDLVLGTSTSSNTADWNLATFRYGPKGAPGVLTLRAAGDIVFNNALSDGFNAVSATAANGNSSLWLATLMAIDPDLPINTQSWSYRIASGADFTGADFRSLQSAEALSASGKGSVIVGEFYAAVPNTATNAVGQNGLTANSLAITGTGSRTRYEVVRTGTGSIDIAAGIDVQLRNQFATIYTAGVALPTPTQIFQPGDFVVPLNRPTGHPAQDPITQGAIQQAYAPVYAMAGGNLAISAQRDIGRFTLYNGAIIADSSRQLPTNWLYRRGYVDPTTGLFGVGGVTTSSPTTTFNDPSASTTWWIDYSNFFQGFGALGGGNIDLSASRDLVNADAVIPTNARMAGRDPSTGLNVAPDASKLLEHGGGDLSVYAGRNIDGGSFLVERGTGTLFADGDITTNSARSISRGILAGSTAEILDPLTWVPVMLYGGKTSFDVTARGNVLIGPAINTFFLPQGLNNKYWYKTQFNTLSEEASLSVTSYGGDVTHRFSVTMPGEQQAIPILSAYMRQFTINAAYAAYYQPWIRMSENRLSSFQTILSVGFPTLRSTAYIGDINLVGTYNLAPSSVGTLDLLAGGSIVGLQPSGKTTVVVNGVNTEVTAWTSASINVSDADPDSLPTITSPLAYQALVGRALLNIRDSQVDPLGTVSTAFRETGSYSGVNASVAVKSALHASYLLHANDSNPVRIYATGGDITGLTLYSPKFSRIVADQDISDIAFYLQNVSSENVSIVSAGRDLIPYNENTALRSIARNISLFNYIVDPAKSTVLTDANGIAISTTTLPGDIQIGGPGALEILAGRNIDLGTGANFTEGTGVGISSIGRYRNPFLPFEGADIFVMSGIHSSDGGAAVGLMQSDLAIESFLSTYASGLVLGDGSADDDDEEWRAMAAIRLLFGIARDDSGGAEADAALAALMPVSASSSSRSAQEYGWGPWQTFGDAFPDGQISTRVRDVRTTSGGSITILAPGSGISMAPEIYGNPLTPPGIVTEYGGEVSIFINNDLDIGQARIFTLRGGDMTIWSANGSIAAGSAAKTVVTAPPTRVSIDSTSAEVQTDLGGLATGGGIGVLASVKDVEAGNVYLIAPRGTVDAGDAGIRATGDISVAAQTVLNADNISAAGTSTGVPATAAPAAPNIAGLTSGANASAATSAAAADTASRSQQNASPEETPSLITVDVLGYGGGEEDSGSAPASRQDGSEDDERRRDQAAL